MKEDTMPSDLALVGLSFGSRPRDGEDPVNQKLAERADEIARIWHPTCIVHQWELTRFSKRVVEHVVERKGEEFLNTHDVLLEAKVWCDKHGVKEVILVCGKFHAYRARKTAENTGFTVVDVKTISDTWDKKSTQWWTRGPFRNLLREVPACIYFYLKGWM